MPLGKPEDFRKALRTADDWLPFWAIIFIGGIFLALAVWYAIVDSRRTEAKIAAQCSAAGMGTTTAYEQNGKFQMRTTFCVNSRGQIFVPSLVEPIK